MYLFQIGSVLSNAYLQDKDELFHFLWMFLSWLYLWSQLVIAGRCFYGCCKIYTYFSAEDMIMV